MFKSTISLGSAACPTFEITDINRAYLDQGRLQIYPLGRGYAWLDGGTPSDLFEASQFIRVMETRTGLKIGCPEEVAISYGVYYAGRAGDIGTAATNRRLRGIPAGYRCD